MLPGRKAATKPSGRPMAMANPIAAMVNISDGHSRAAIISATGWRERNEMPRSSVANWLT